ncbi:MAG: ABC transporter permease, partial [Candidatus Methanomethylophilaceae archaeon]|nr:ABC transporter permease [Candidatus Methanomethylophilaceae archaeon]
MSDLTNVMKKELREYLSISSVISVVLVVVIFAFMGTMMSGEADKITSPSDLLVINCDDNSYAVDEIRVVYDAMFDGTSNEYVHVVNSQYSNVDSNYIHGLMSDNGCTDAIVICPDFYDNISSLPVVKGQMMLYFQFEASGLFGGASSSMAQSIVAVVNERISQALVSSVPGLGPSASSPIDMGSTYTYVNGEVVENVTPIEISSALMSQNFTMPLIIMVILTMIGSIVISSMGNEKENKTLETLLTMPVKRTTIVTGKLISAAIAGLVFGAAYLVGMMFYMEGMTATMVSSVDLADIGLTLSITDWAIVMVMMFLAILSALGMCMILGAFTKNFKAAQTMILPLAIMAMIPMFIIMFMGWE